MSEIKAGRVECFLVEHVQEEGMPEELAYWRRADTKAALRDYSGDLVRSRMLLPPGSMWWAEGMHHTVNRHRYRFDKCLLVMLPNGSWWNIDGPSCDRGVYSSAPVWTRTGVAPKVTVSPSIHVVGSYHGWLRDGYLEDA